MNIGLLRLPLLFIATFFLIAGWVYAEEASMNDAAMSAEEHNGMPQETENSDTKEKNMSAEEHNGMLQETENPDTEEKSMSAEEHNGMLQETENPDTKETLHTDLKPKSEQLARKEYGEFGVRVNVGRDLEEVGIKEKLGHTLPLSAVFTNHAGEVFPLSKYFNAEVNKPVLLSFYYAKCASLCQFVLNEEHEMLKKLPMKMGEEYQAISVSFDPRDTVADIKVLKGKYSLSDTAAANNREGEYSLNADDNWVFLRSDLANIQRLTSALGFFYDFIERSGEFAHTAAIYVITPKGKISKYFYGLNYPAFDVKMSLIEAKAEKTITTMDRVLLYCYRYDDEAGGYVLYAWNMMRIAGVLIVCFLGVLFFFMMRVERKRKKELTSTLSNEAPMV